METSQTSPEDQKLPVPYQLQHLQLHHRWPPTPAVSSLYHAQGKGAVKEADLLRFCFSV